MSADRVSVVISAYNAERSIERAIRSAACQTLQAWEIVVVDDGSVDDTANVVESLQTEFATLVLRRLQTNSGPAAARNAGIEVATGDWICILDADDWMAPDRLARLVGRGNDLPADIVVDNIRIVQGSDEPSWTLGVASCHEEIVSAALFVERSRPFRGEADWGLLKPIIRRDFLVRATIRYREASRHGEDFLLVLDLLLEGARYLYVPSPGYFYTSRASGLSRTRVDYSTMILHCKLYLNDPRSVLDRRTKRAIRRRSSALRALDFMLGAMPNYPDRRGHRFCWTLLHNPLGFLLFLREAFSRAACPKPLFRRSP